MERHCWQTEGSANVYLYIIKPYKKSEIQNRDDLKRLNKLVSSNRVLIERIFGIMKRQNKIINERLNTPEICME